MSKDRPVAYWLTEPASVNVFNGLAPSGDRYRRRVLAEEMTHIFHVTEDESQIRGVTWFHAALLQGKDFHEYQGGVVQSARVAAHTFGFLKQTAAEEISTLTAIPGSHRATASNCRRCDRQELRCR
jgi:capsid protein